MQGDVVAPTFAVVYAAKSSADPHGSLRTQIEACLASLPARGLKNSTGILSRTKDSQATAVTVDRVLRKPKRLVIEAASVRGCAELWVEHSDRLARGDGINADHLGEIFFELRRQRVRLRSVQDDGNLEDVIRAVLIGERNTEDSKAEVRCGPEWGASAARAWLLARKQTSALRPTSGSEATGTPTRRVGALSRPRRDEAVVVRRIFDQFISGQTQAAIRRGLEAAGIAAPGRRRTGGTTARSPRSCAAPPTSDSYQCRVGTTVEGVHEPILDPEKFARARSRPQVPRSALEGSRFSCPRRAPPRAWGLRCMWLEDDHARPAGSEPTARGTPPTSVRAASTTAEALALPPSSRAL